MSDKKAGKIFDINDVELDLSSINSVENIISKILAEDSFNKLNYLQTRKSTNENETLFKPDFKVLKNGKDIEFVSINTNSLAPYAKIISENEFYKIIGVTKKGLSKRSGRYQESLYGHYNQAVKEKDEGYISDILTKAVVFNNNLNYVKSLTKNKKFMKEWRRNLGKESPVSIFKNSGNLRTINIIKESV